MLPERRLIVSVLTTGFGLAMHNCGGNLRTLAGAQGFTTIADRLASRAPATVGNGRGCADASIGTGLGIDASTGWAIDTAAGGGGGGGGGGLARDGAAIGVAATGRVAMGTSALCKIDNVTIPELELDDSPPPLASPFRGR